MLTRLLFRLLVTSITPPSVCTTSTVFALARPEYLKELIDFRLCGSVVMRAPCLPIRLRPVCRRFWLKQDVSRRIGQRRSGEIFDMAVACGSR